MSYCPTIKQYKTTFTHTHKHDSYKKIRTIKSKEQIELLFMLKIKQLSSYINSGATLSLWYVGIERKYGRNCERLIRRVLSIVNRSSVSPVWYDDTSHGPGHHCAGKCLAATHAGPPAVTEMIKIMPVSFRLLHLSIILNSVLYTRSPIY